MNIDFSKGIDDFTYKIYLGHIKTLKGTKKPLTNIANKLVKKLIPSNISIEQDLAKFKNYCYAHRIVAEAMYINSAKLKIKTDNSEIFRDSIRKIISNPLLTEELAIETFKYTGESIGTYFYPYTLQSYVRLYKITNAILGASEKKNIVFNISKSNIGELAHMKNVDYFLDLYIKHSVPDITLDKQSQKVYSANIPIEELIERKKLYTLLEELHYEHVNKHTA